MACCPKAASNALVCEACGGPTHSKPPAQLLAEEALLECEDAVLGGEGSCRAGPLEMRPVGEFSKSLELVSYLLSPDDRDTYGWNCAPALLVTCCGPDPVYHQVFPCLERGEVSKVGPDRDRYPHKRRGCGQRSVKLRASSIPQGEGRNQDGVPPSQLSRRPVPPPWPQEPSRQTSVL